MRSQFVLPQVYFFLPGFLDLGEFSPVCLTALSANTWFQVLRLFRFHSLSVFVGVLLALPFADDRFVSCFESVILSASSLFREEDVVCIVNFSRDSPFFSPVYGVSSS